MAKKSKRKLQYEDNKSAKVGTEITCPICGTKFVKRQYSQAFCDGKCKDAYWKIAGEQMGLGKPRKPQFENCSIPHYCIFINHTGEIYDDCFYGSRCLLAFPTAEMRDAFLENFKDLIELCKELL